MSTEIRFEVLPKEISDLAIELASVEGGDVRIETRDLRPPSSDATHGAYNLGIAEPAVILLTLTSLTASAAALAAAIISYCNTRRSDHSLHEFTLIVDKNAHIEVNQHTTVGELAALLTAKPVSIIRIHYSGETPTYQAEPAELLSPDMQAAPTHPQSRGNVFISYAHADNDGTNPSHRWLDRLQKHLSPLVSEERIAVWSDKEIDIGDEWQDQIGQQLKEASAAILLISPSFLSSHYIRSSELPVLLKRAVDEGLVVIPVIIRPCLFSEVRFKYPDPAQGPRVFRLSNLQSANPPSRSLIEMDEGEQDRVLLAVAKRVLKLADMRKTTRP